MVRSTTRRREAGFTVLEMAITVVVASFALAGMGGVFKATDTVTQESRLRMRVANEQRRNLVALTNVLQAADLSTLGNMDVTGTSSRPTFQRVSGQTDGTKALAAEEEILWLASSEPVDGIAYPGRLVLRSGGVDTVIADKVPKDGFLLRQDGRTLTIELTSYFRLLNKTHKTVGSTSITMRN
jgi:hypothetical protein